MRDWHAFVRANFRLPALAPEREARIVRELAAQLEDFYREAIAAGATEADADAHACRQIHDWDRMAEDVWQADRRHARPGYERIIEPRLERLTSDPYGPGQTRGGLLVFAHILRDTRYALRQLARTPGFTVVAILTLALGIGASTAIFSVVNGVLLRPLAYQHPDELVRVHEILQKFGRFSVAPATFLDWRQQNTVFAHIGAFNGTGATLVGSTGAERLAGGLVSWDMFDLLQVTPAIGRTFRADEAVPGKDAVIILSHRMWQQRFGGDRRHPRPERDAQRRTSHGDRRDAGVVRVHAGGRVLAPTDLHGQPDARRTFSRRHRTAETRRHAAAGRRRDQDHLRTPGGAVSREQRERIR